MRSGFTQRSALVRNTSEGDEAQRRNCDGQNNAHQECDVHGRDPARPDQDLQRAPLHEFEDEVIDRLCVLNADRAREEERLGIGGKNAKARPERERAAGGAGSYVLTRREPYVSSTNRAFSWRSIAKGVTCGIPRPMHASGILILFFEVDATSCVTTVCPRASACPTR